ncbi:peptide-methionine (S)-S-oxide reductase MsrA [Rhodovibrionaceae bacterium A322]
MSRETASFGAGCFWGVEAAFAAMEGVTETAVGYMGGNTQDPTYKEVCSDDTGHAEVVQLQFDPEVISYETLLKAFFGLHDPTQLNRQGPDVGRQYRSVVYYHDDAQKAAAEQVKQAEDQSGRHRGPVVTELSAAPEFFRAEEYHQQYLAKRGLASCSI